MFNHISGNIKRVAEKVWRTLNKDIPIISGKPKNKPQKQSVLTPLVPKTNPRWGVRERLTFERSFPDFQAAIKKFDEQIEFEEQFVRALRGEYSQSEILGAAETHLAGLFVYRETLAKCINRLYELNGDPMIQTVSELNSLIGHMAKHPHSGHK